MNAQNYKNVCPKDFDFCEILKMREKYLKIHESFLLLFYTVKRQDAHR